MTRRRLWKVARRPLAVSVLAGLYGASLGLAGWAGYGGGMNDHGTLVRAWAPSALAATAGSESGKGGGTVAAAAVAAPAPPAATPAPPPSTPPPAAVTHATPPPAPAVTPTAAATKAGPSGPPELFQGEGKSDAGKDGSAKKATLAAKTKPAGRGDS